MARKTFGIYSEDLSGCDLFIETGTEYISCWCKNSETKQVKAFELFSFTEASSNDIEHLMRDIQSDSRLFTEKFENVNCIWGHEKCVCIPEEFYRDEIAAPYIEMVFGECNETKFCTNTVNNCVTLGLIPAKILSEYSNRYTISANAHKYYQLLKGQSLGDSDNKMHLVFYNTHLIISVFKDSNLQLMQSFPYKLPADVLYYVLNIINTYELPLHETLVHASGMIDTASPLYGTLRAYINHFFIEPVDKNLFIAEEFHAYPLHYFSSFCQYDL